MIKQVTAAIVFLLAYIPICFSPGFSPEVLEARAQEQARIALERLDEEAGCLATAIYMEARGEPLKAQRAVLDTVYNRMVQSRSSACEVVTARAQFSWYKGQMKPYTREMDRLLKQAINHPRVLRNEKSMWFYSGEPPYWAAEMDCRAIGQLNFCQRTQRT
jgi:spore germination cell wall hydrolase CwlJ-like protein